jgi:phospholipase A1
MRAVRIGVQAAALAALASHAGIAGAQLGSCATIEDDRQRLACYDAIARPHAPASAHDASGPSSNARAKAPDARPAVASELEEQWELRPDLRRGTFTLRPYRPLYALVHATDSLNGNPQSPTRSLDRNDVELDRVEAKMQLSFRTKLAEDIAGSRTDAWFGYTQQSYWQIGNSRHSSPFRETDYLPEAILVHPLQYDVGAFHARYVAVSLTHESNGRGQALSRSWNRLIGELALESGPWALHLRPWVRLSRGSGNDDDNPDIEDYVGRGELILVYRAGRHVVKVGGRHTLRGGERSRGSAHADWAFPLTGGLNGHVQVFTGYGENLIDYNHRQTSVGLGLSFFD